METKNKEIVIIGAGLSGLASAYFLRKLGLKVTILEAATRPGGRIQTVQGVLGTPLELGATWFSDQHTQLLSLIDELGLNKFPQFASGISLFQTKSFIPPQKFYVPDPELPSYRLAGGTQTLIDRLIQALPGDQIRYDAKVTAIQARQSHLVVETEKNQHIPADIVILCMPPQLVSQIAFSPALPHPLNDLLPTVHTWMSGAVKFTLEYSTPFWRRNNYSGMLYSHAGIITEMYDHCNDNVDRFGFTGFLNGGAASYSQDTRKELVLEHLGQLLGEDSTHPTAYYDKVWTDKFVLAGNPVTRRPHQNNGHPLLQNAYFDSRLYFCGTETATQFFGYMEGAVQSARKLTEKLCH